MGDHEDCGFVKLTAPQRYLRMFDGHVRRWRIDGGLVVEATTIGAFLWVVVYLINETSF
jgi:hypothetical protein